MKLIEAKVQIVQFYLVKDCSYCDSLNWQHFKPVGISPLHLRLSASLKTVEFYREIFTSRVTQRVRKLTR